MITLSLLMLAALQAPTQRDPLGPLVAEALHNNLGLETERLAERRATADVSAARGLFLPSINLDSTPRFARSTSCGVTTPFRRISS
ncbi:MAG: hypothetical protein AUI57_03905 [Candidatus Rokubacteria bacterium 13_1_40CM_2_68_8]|nr:MAG: hypothetical protein AUI57_03905 [Candidatus Rokubacteria bacterium 13_1_40CM_2_68_8]